MTTRCGRTAQSSNVPGQKCHAVDSTTGEDTQYEKSAFTHEASDPRVPHKRIGFTSKAGICPHVGSMGTNRCWPIGLNEHGQQLAIGARWHAICTEEIVRPGVIWVERKNSTVPGQVPLEVHNMQLLSGFSNPAFISALAAICGSLVGALGSASSAWIAQRHQNRRDLLARKIFHREQLYADFIGASAKVVVDAAQNPFQDPGRLVPTYALLSRIRLSSSKNVVESAERVVKTVLAAYSEPNLTPEEFQSRATTGEDPLLEFSNICRHDLESLWSSY
jgi:hypothetical protein